MTERTNAMDALDRLAAHSPADAARVGKYMAYLEDQNDRLARRVAASLRIVEEGKLNFMRAGWASAWATFHKDPDALHGDPSAAFDAVFDPMKGVSDD